MVLFKRKPVQFLPPAAIDDEEAEVWQIAQTGEYFASYESYIERMDFYKQRRFNDEITGHSGLTFFEALDSELAGGREVEEAFPEALKGPILRKVQFQIVSRLDSLVDQIYDDFKQDYFPGEEVTISSLDGEKSHASIRDKTAFGPRALPDGTRSKPMTRYQVLIKDSGEETMVTDESISRDRGVFTKSMLRSFIKRTVSREAWNGAPWLVKQEYATQYHIDTKIPIHLRYDTKLMERKLAHAQKRVSTNGDGLPTSTSPVRLPELKPAPKGPKPKGSKGLKWPLSVAVHGRNPSYAASNGDHAATRSPSPPHLLPPPPPPLPKYPIEDLQLDPRESPVRPPLRFMCHNPPIALESDQNVYQHIDMASIGPLLEVWDTLNVYCEVFKLDSFTFDDFVEAMTVASEEMPVQLIDEIHCAVLKSLVHAERDGGKVQFSLPELDDEESGGEGAGVEDRDAEDNAREETPESQEVAPARATRGSLAKQEAKRLRAEAAAAEEEKELAELATKHRAEVLLKEFDWLGALRKREFPNGGWEQIIVGLLFQMSKNERLKEKCESLLLELVPPEDDPTQESVRIRYAEMNINSRVKLLQLLCMLTTETKAFRSYMDECSETMTGYRKEKLEWQRQKKLALEELRPLQEQRKILLPDNTPLSPSLRAGQAEDDADVAESQQQLENGVKSETDEADGRPLGKRKSISKASKSKHRPAEERSSKHEKKQKTKQEEGSKIPAQSKEFIKLLKEINTKEARVKQCEEEITTIENDLREADCPRTRVLGKDRFWNRYYWFERNGMPYGGLPTSSTASAGYANGCLWIQGPDELEREGYLDLPEELQKEYQAKFGMTIPERKRLEEGQTSIYNANQWGYISEPDDLDHLIKWLDPRGFNELKLRKELVGFRDKIVANMENRKSYLSANGDEERAKREETTKRASLRIRDKTPEAPHYRCLQWENTMVLEADEQGHLHSQPPPPPRSKKATRKREAAEAAVAPAPKTRRR